MADRWDGHALPRPNIDESIEVVANGMQLPVIRPVHTYSIIAHDPDGHQMGVGAQSHYFSVGSILPWIQPGVGVVATQAMVEPSHGLRGLAQLAKGDSPFQALRALLKQDQNPSVRQVAILDAEGRTAVHTGERCIPEAGHISGEDFSVQANMMLRSTVWQDMARAFERGTGDLAERIYESLRAAEKAGGDIRGKQSAVIIIADTRNRDRPWAGRIMDLRVDDHSQPLEELERLMHLHQAYRHVDEGDKAMGEEEFEKAREEYEAAHKLAPGNKELIFWHAISLANTGHVEEAEPMFREVFKEKGWVKLVTRLSAVGMLQTDPEPIAGLAKR